MIARSAVAVRRPRLLALLFVACLVVWIGLLSGVAHAQGVVGYEEQATTGSISGGTTGDVIASCSPGNRVLSGGFKLQSTNDLVVSSLPTASNDGWDVSVTNAGRLTTSVTVTAICVSGSVPGYEEQTNSVVVPASGFSDVNVACSSGNKVVGGGFNLGDPTIVALSESDPSLSATITDHNWNLFVHNTSADAGMSVEVAAICSSGSVSGYQEPSQIQNTPASSAGTDERGRQWGSL